MFVLRLIVSTDGLGNEGDRVVVDPSKAPIIGDWVLMQDDLGYFFLPFTDGLTHEGAVIGVIP